MPMELYSSEAFVRDIVNAISEAEGKPLNFGGNHHQGIDRSYAFQLITEAKQAIEGNFPKPRARKASSAAASRAAAIREAIERANEPAPARAAKPRTRKLAKT